MEKEIHHFYADSKQAWRAWLQEHHDKEQAVWLVCYKKQSGVPTISWSEAVDEALCFGWIDSVRRKVDEHQFIQMFSRRKPHSTWSKVNKEKVAQLTADALMMPAGLKAVAAAKQNGSWTVLDEVEAFVIPADLLKAFRNHAGAQAYFSSLSKSVQKRMLQWVAVAKRPETRQKRIDEVATAAARQKRPAQFE